MSETKNYFSAAAFEYATSLYKNQFKEEAEYLVVPENMRSRAVEVLVFSGGTITEDLFVKVRFKLLVEPMQEATWIVRGGKGEIRNCPE